MSGVPEHEATAADFIMVRAALVRRLGSANNALVWTRIHYRCSTETALTVTDEDGVWWPVTREELGEETGLSGDQVKRALAALLEDGYLVEREHRRGGNYDRRRSYRPLLDLTGRNRPVERAAPPSEPGDIAQRAGRYRPVLLNQDLGRQPQDVSGGGATVATLGPWLALCTRLADLIEANGSKRPTITKKWLDAARLMVERDGRSPQQVANMIEWCQEDEFWRSNILSMPKLRERYDQMRLQAMRSGKGSVTEAGRKLYEQYAAAEAAAKERNPVWSDQKSLSS